jgi:hypothetical protein
MNMPHKFSNLVIGQEYQFTILGRNKRGIDGPATIVSLVPKASDFS